ncbi:MAG: YajQ family cyclic di-GMP-binding protein [Acidiferrobacterales bacterium]|nr:YajQ family cyclic di-GMP-binding protein [Acidiferrobacterales bacterium]
MPSFDIVSEIDWQEVKNAVNMANKEITNRYDFKGSDARVDEADPKLTLHADDSFKVSQVMDVLLLKLSKRGIDVNALDKAAVKSSATGKSMQEITVLQGIDTDRAKKMVKLIKAEKFKVQAAIQGEQVRVTGKKRDDLQQVIAFLKEQKLDIPLQFTNFRD